MTLPKTSLAMVQTAPRTLEPMELPLPEIDDDSGLVRIEACGICGSDYEQFEGVLRTPMPAVPGHEPLGVVAKIGDQFRLCSLATRSSRIIGLKHERLLRLLSGISWEPSGACMSMRN